MEIVCGKQETCVSGKRFVICVCLFREWEEIYVNNILVYGIEVKDQQKL